MLQMKHMLIFSGVPDTVVIQGLPMHLDGFNGKYSFDTFMYVANSGSIGWVKESHQYSGWYSFIPFTGLIPIIGASIELFNYEKPSISSWELKNQAGQTVNVKMDSKEQDKTNPSGAWKDGMHVYIAHDAQPVNFDKMPTLDELIKKYSNQM